MDGVAGLHDLYMAHALYACWATTKPDADRTRLRNERRNKAPQTAFGNEQGCKTFNTMPDQECRHFRSAAPTKLDNGKKERDTSGRARFWAREGGAGGGCTESGGA